MHNGYYYNYEGDSITDSRILSEKDYEFTFKPSTKKFPEYTITIRLYTEKFDGNGRTILEVPPSC